MDAVLVATVLADRAPARALRDQIEALAIDGSNAAMARAAALFDSVFYRLPPFADARLPAVVAPVLRQQGRLRAASLLDGLAAQLATPADPPADPEAAAIVAAPEQDDMLLGALEGRERGADWAGSAALFETVWPCVRPMGEYWVYFRMSAVYARLGDGHAARLLAALAVQIEPASHMAGEPYARLLAGFREAGRWRDAAELALRQRVLVPHAPITSPAELDGLLAAAGTLAAPPPRPSWRSHALFPRATRPPQQWTCYGNGVPTRLKELQQPMHCEDVSIAELADAEVLVADDTVAVLSADGAVQTELSVGRVPTLLPHRFAALARAGRAPARSRVDTAVLTSDEFPAPNLCHFLFDHAPRLLLYRQLGLDLGAVTVIGPAPRMPYQQETLARLGVRDWRATGVPARFHVRRLFVASTCRHLQHPAHWGADWAIAGMRALFDLARRDPPRRLLISRADAAVRRIVNMDEIEAMLAPLGFTTIVPGRLSFAEQIAAFRDATHVVAPHGAGLGNVLFCAPGTHVLEVFHPQYSTWSYAVPSAALGLDYASAVARDGDSDAPAFNDPDWPLPERTARSGRDIRLDPDLVRAWLADVDKVTINPRSAA